MKRKMYLNKLSLNAARQTWQTTFANQITRIEEVEVSDACGRVTVEPVFARRSAPHFAAAAMDGIAVYAADTSLASERNPIYLTEKENAFWLDTGDPIPDGCNAVIKAEEVNRTEDGRLQLEKPASPWQHVRGIGESVIRGEMVLSANHQITSYDIGGLLEAGITRIKVWSRPQVGIIPTGTELVPAEATPAFGQLVEFNSQVLKASVTEWGGLPHVTAILPDQYDQIKAQIIAELAVNDITVVLSGSSAGAEDFTVKILQELGEVLVHGVNIMPGKPVILARINGKPVIGLPGYPLAAILNAHLFVRPLVYQFAGAPVPEIPSVEATVQRKIPSEVGITEFQRVNLAYIDGEMVAVPRKKGSAAMESLLKADGIMPIPDQREGLDVGQKTTVYLLKPRKEIERNLLLIGSHDLTLDLVINQLRAERAGFDLNIQSVGSMAGLTSLKRNECHMAGAHLLDEVTGEYNFSFIEKVLAGQEMALIHLVYRMQGFMVKPGNPKVIHGIADLVREDVTYMNRQRGAGTRVLLDGWLTQNGYTPEQIRGYEREEYTHIGAASAVAAGTADTALGILAAARAMDLDFVPLAEERYDLVLPLALLDDDRIQRLIGILSSPSFKARAEALGGYRTTHSGQVWRTREDVTHG